LTFFKVKNIILNYGLAKVFTVTEELTKTKQNLKSEKTAAKLVEQVFNDFDPWKGLGPLSSD